ncbi:MAG TPA: phage holin family protein [Candidatus Saccharimonadia bacterium]
MIRAFLLRWLINFLGLWAAANVLSGVDYGGNPGVLIIGALLFSVVNAVIRPLLIVLALPAILLTLGLFTFIVNGFMLYLVTLIYPALQVTSFWQAVWAVLIIWIVNYLFTNIMEGSREKSV